MSWQTEPEPGLEELLEYIRGSRGVNFTGYKHATLTRRIRKRMGQVNISSYGEYADFLEADADEFNTLFDTILINVTGFFRDRSSWDYLAEEVLPKILQNKPPGDQIRVWSAGCASGEEAYTIAILLAEALSENQFRHQVKIFATDLDNDALEKARRGVYPAKAVEDIPAELQSRYLESAGDQFAIRSGPRHAVIFGRHDLTTDAPIGRLDLLLCRNTLMYFNADLQSRVLKLFHFALAPHGYLFLGKAEMLLLRNRLFTALSVKHRIFEKSNVSLHRQLPPGEVSPDFTTRDRTIADLLVDAAPTPLLAVDEEGRLVEANSAARSMFGITLMDIGEPLQNLEVSHRPLELHARIERAHQQRRQVEDRGIERTLPNGEIQVLDITVTPLVLADGSINAVAFSFVDVTAFRGLDAELQRARQDLETAEKELLSSKEELETTNEELQSSNEELETTNEELQASNEELETINEELQASNEELETTNEELRVRATEVTDLSERLTVLVSSLDSAVIALDREMHVELWNQQAEEWWGLRSDDVMDRAFATLDIGLPVGALLPVLQQCLYAGAQREDVEVEGFTRTGRPARMRVTCTPVTGPEPVSGIVLLIDLEQD